jgi:Ca2+-binding RTX toxin-like protein
MSRSLLIPVAGACALLALGAAAPAASAKLTTSFKGRVLTVTGSKGGDRVVVTCSGDGFAKVNGKNPKGGPVPCRKVVEVDADTGAGRDVIDFSGVSGEFGKARFPGFGTATGTAALGGAGNDRYIPSRFAFNVFYGGAGADRATGGPARDVISGGAGNDRVNGARGRDTISGEAGNDRLAGGTGADLLNGGAGDDRLGGGAGADILGGGPGRDILRGGPGRDRLIGGPGRDILRGGPGADTEIEKPKNP